MLAVKTHQPPAIEPKKHPPVNVETIAPVTAELGLSKSPRKVLNVSTEEMMPLKKTVAHLSTGRRAEKLFLSTPVISEKKRRRQSLEYRTQPERKDVKIPTRTRTIL